MSLGKMPVAGTSGADLVIIQAVTPTAAAPGEAITHTLVYSNTGSRPALDVVITDLLPLEITGASFASAGAAITLTPNVAPYEWQVEDLAPGAGGVITITALLDPALTGTSTVTNTATITSAFDIDPSDNTAMATIAVKPVAHGGKMWLPVIVKEFGSTP